MEKELKIIYKRLLDLKEWNKNPRDHDLGSLHISIDEFDFRKPIIINSNNNQIEAGHGRLKALIQKKQSGEKLPKYITVNENGEWLVPVIEFNDDEKTQHRFALTDNRTQELGSYNEPLLLENLIELKDDLLGTGFDCDYIDELSNVLDSNFEEPIKEKEIDENLDTDHQCPKCGYQWS